MKTAIKIAGLCLTLALASCGGGDSTTSTNPNTIVAGDPTAPTGSPAATQVVANTGTVTVTTEPNNVVSIGASGTVFKTADTTGKAVFTGLSAGAVDVHVFSADGYSASSYYGINSDKVNVNIGSNSSVVDIYVQATNAVGFTQYYLDDQGNRIKTCS